MAPKSYTSEPLSLDASLLGTQVALLEQSGYKHNPRCCVCRALNPVTKIPMRADIEEIAIKNGTQQAINFMKGLGIDVNIRTLQRHIEQHAPYLRGGLWIKRTQAFIKEAIEEHSNAEEAVQNIINIGNKLVQTGELPVTEKLYIEALKVQQKGKAESTLKGFLKNVEEGMFVEGETVDSPASSLPAPQNEALPVKPMFEDEIKLKPSYLKDHPETKMAAPEVEVKDTQNPSETIPDLRVSPEVESKPVETPKVEQKAPQDVVPTKMERIRAKGKQKSDFALPFGPKR